MMRSRTLFLLLLVFSADIFAAMGETVGKVNTACPPICARGDEGSTERLNECTASASPLPSIPPPKVKEVVFERECGLGWESHDREGSAQGRTKDASGGTDVAQESRQGGTTESKEVEEVRQWHESVRTERWEELLSLHNCSAREVLQHFNQNTESQANTTERLVLNPGGRHRHGFASQVNSVMIPALVRLVGLDGGKITAATGEGDSKDDWLWNYGCREHLSLQATLAHANSTYQSVSRQHLHDQGMRWNLQVRRHLHWFQQLKPCYRCVLPSAVGNADEQPVRVIDRIDLAQAAAQVWFDFVPSTKAAIDELVYAWLENAGTPSRYLAIHVRAGDKESEDAEFQKHTDPEFIWDSLLEIQKNHQRGHTRHVFVATDDCDLVQKLKQHEALMVNKSTGQHKEGNIAPLELFFAPCVRNGGFNQQMHNEGIMNIHECGGMYDFWATLSMLSQAELFLGSQSSNVARLVTILRGRDRPSYGHNEVNLAAHWRLG